ncbi:glycoside hydrolase family 73 protein [Duganella callida]|uniref:Flagellar assembly peptidoglycan hydrolase FlgJ n=1 Tax=Duganella callida TaxID=2561932 RepID=A0A4Y9SGW3_9BURK|nr:glucosaminidase domain-containing protein [Duganella callida]TFW23601.1 flagellar assembly peptidoglycan hydrolase FlgJ [Duganella callida]
MRQLSGMQATAPTAATVSNMSASRPTPGLGSAATTGGFSVSMQQIQNDVASFIANGGGGFAAEAPAAQSMSLQALALLRGQGVIGDVPDQQGSTTDEQQQFLASIKPWAEDAAGKLGVAPELVAAHAALESGWGKQPLRNGTASSNNLFGVKAGGGWQGEVALARTTEYEQGAMLKKTERFRSYPDAASAFRDYADLLSSNPRYQAALNAGTDAHAFASGLAKAGYATDPHYADKLSKLATRLQRSGGLGSITATEN